MKVKFNQFERAAGLFVVIAFLTAAAGTVTVAIKKGWFASKVTYHTVLTTADGLHSGTLVSVSGLRAGAVTEVDLVSASEVRISFEVLEKFRDRIRADSRVQILRPFVIGEKVLELTIGSDSEPILPDGATIKAEATIDMMDLLSGRRLGPFLGTLEGLMHNMTILADAFADERRMKSFVKMFDSMTPLVKSLQTTLIEARPMIKNVDQMAIGMAKMSHELNGVLPQAVAHGPEVVGKMEELVDNLNTLTATLAPMMSEVGPKLPKASLRALEALDEAVVVLKAMQKSFLLRGNVQDVREEETRRPASGAPQ